MLSDMANVDEKKVLRQGSQAHNGLGEVLLADSNLGPYQLL